MKHFNNFMIIGGDCRFSYMSRILAEYGKNAKRICPGDYTADDFTDTDVFILPVPVSRDSVSINAPKFDEPFRFCEFVRLVPEGSYVFGGLFTDEQLRFMKEKNIRAVDYYKDEMLTVRNAVPTAEGVIGILINSLPCTVNSLKCAVTGYGRCSKALTSRLAALGSDVTVVVRSKKNTSEARLDGFPTCYIKDFENICGGFDVVVNTVPSRILGENIISKLNKKCIIIEIASSPFGTDFDSASKNGINVIKAGSLPGRTAPETAGKIICDTVLRYLSEVE